MIGTLAVDGWAVVWYSDEEPILGMFTSTMEFFKQQQNVMLRGTGPHDFIYNKIEEKTGQQR